MTTDTESFGYLLRKLRREALMTQTILSEQISYSPVTISNWERGRTKPDRETVLAISQILTLNPSQTNQLLLSLQYPPISVTGTDRRKVVFNETTEAAEVHEQAPNVAEELRVQIQDLSHAIEDLQSRVINGSVTPRDQGSISTELQDIKDSIAELYSTSREITAPVSFPTQEEMEVRLIPTTKFSIIEEYRADENRWFSFSTYFAGAATAFLVNIITGGKASAESWIIFGILILLTLACGWQGIIFMDRAKREKELLLKAEIKPKGESTDTSVTDVGIMGHQ